jgi:hypothetical protein
MPVILAGLFFLAYESDGGRLRDATATVALGVFAALTWLWGAHLASESVLAEVRGRTWDWQRMSALRPWTLAWGKLVGATAYPWYGGALCLGVYALAQPKSDVSKGWVAALFVVGGILAQAGALLAALHAASRGRLLGRAQSGAYLVFGFFGLYPILMGAMSAKRLEWYGLATSTLEFAVCSLVAFSAFAVAGVWVRIRRELRVRTLPVVWPAFVLFLMVWTGGFPDTGAHPRAAGALLAAFGVAVLLAWGAAIADRKDPVALRRLARAVTERRWRRCAEELPPWLVALPLVVAAWAPLFVRPQLLEGLAGDHELRWTITAVVLFLLRDFALLVYLNLGARPKRADLFALVVFLVGYLLVPLVLSAGGAKPLAALFFPDPERGPLSAMGALFQVVVAGRLLATRWRAQERAIAGQPAAPAVPLA